MGGVAEVAAHDVAAERQRQAGVALPALAEVEHLRQTHLLVGDLALVDEQTEIGLSLQHGVRDLVEGHLDQRRVADVEPQQERGGRVLAGDGGDPRGQLGGGDRLPRDQDRAVALPHRGAGIHHPVLLGDQQIGGERDRRHLELARARAAVERLDVLQHVLDLHAGDRHLPRRQRVEHERVVGVGAVADPYRLRHRAPRLPQPPVLSSGGPTIRLERPYAERGEVTGIRIATRHTQSRTLQVELASAGRRM